MIRKFIPFIFVIALIYSLNSGAFIINIRLALGDIPFPYLFWLLLALYSAVYSKAFKIPFNARLISKAVLFGIFFHTLMLLIKLKYEESRGMISFSSDIYRIYFKFFTSSVFSFVSAFSGYKFSGRQPLPEKEPVYAWPLLGLNLFVFFSIFNQGEYVLLFFYCCVFMAAVAIASNMNYRKRFKNLIFVSRKFIKNPAVFLCIVFIFSLCIRIIYLLRTMTNPDYMLTAADGYNYDRMARMYLGSGIPAAQILPLNEAWSWIAHIGTWLYVALFYRLFGTGYFNFCLAQGVLGSISCVYVYFIAKYIFGEAVGRIACVLAALNFSMIFSSIVMDNMGLNIFCSASVILLLLLYRRNNNTGNYNYMFLFALVGSICGFMIMSFYNNIGFLFIILIWLFLLDMNIEKSGVKRSFLHGGIIILFALGVIFTCLSLFGLGHFKSFVNMLSSNFSGTKGFYSDYFTDTNPSKFPEMISLGLGSATEILFYSIPVILEKGLSAGITIFKFFVKSISDLFFSQGYGGFDPVFLVRNSVYFYNLWFYAYLLTFLGIIVSLFNRKMNGDFLCTWLLYLYVASTAFIHIIFFRAEYRYRAMMEPYLIIFGALGLWALFKSAKEKGGI